MEPMKQVHEYCKQDKEPPRMYKIGMFAGMNHVTIKTLRYYDEQGILKPAYVEEENGYRYYIATQIADLHQIMALREIGFTIEEIKAFLQGKSDKEILQIKRQQILKEIAALTAKLSVKRTADAHKGFVADMKINFCGFRIAVSKQCLNIPLFNSLLHKVGGKAVTEAVRSNTG